MKSFMASRMEKYKFQADATVRNHSQATALT